VVGSLVYVADGDAGLQVIDVSNPANPVRVGGYYTGGYASGVQVVGNLAYVANGSAGLQVIYVGNPANPVRVSGYDTSGSATSVQIVGNLAYVADGSWGLTVLRLHGTSSVPNQAPISSGFGATTPQNQPLSITFASLLAPVSDPEGSPINLLSVSTTSTNGAPVVSSATEVVYTPKAGFVGADRFDYVVSDSHGAMSTLPAQIAVLTPGTTVNTVQALVVTASAVSFNFTGLPGRTYVVQRAASLASPWITVGTLTIQPDGSGNYADPSPPKDAAFYRTILVP
jgi:hypothetical protein